METTTKGLLKFICDQMNKLANGEIDVEHLKAQTQACKQANNLYRYELDKAKFLTRNEGAILEDISK